MRAIKTSIDEPVMTLEVTQDIPFHIALMPGRNAASNVGTANSDGFPVSPTAVGMSRVLELA